MRERDDVGAVEIAERIRVAVGRPGRETVDGPVVPMTVSAGVASLVDESDGHGLFRAADSASWRPSELDGTGSRRI